jgi:hypothetical protein
LNLILVIFIVAFPVLTLGCFTYLVVKHHKKLYGPSDYKDEVNFLSTFNNFTNSNEVIEIKQNKQVTSMIVKDPEIVEVETFYKVKINNKTQNFEQLRKNLYKIQVSSEVYKSNVNIENEDSSQSIWLGSNYPFEQVKDILRVCFESNADIKYISYSDDSETLRRNPPKETHNNIFIGGSTNTAISDGCKPLNDKIKNKIINAKTNNELRELIEKHNS